MPSSSSSSNHQRHPILPLLPLPNLTVPYLTNDLLSLLFRTLNKHQNTRAAHPVSVLRPIYLLDYWVLLSLKVNQEALFDTEVAMDKTTHSAYSILERRLKGLKHADLAEFLNLYTICDDEQQLSSADSITNIPNLIVSTPRTKSSNTAVLTAPSLSGIQKSTQKEITEISRELWKVPHIMGCIEYGNLKKVFTKMSEVGARSCESGDESLSKAFEIPIYMHDIQFKEGYKAFQTWRDKRRLTEGQSDAHAVEAMNRSFVALSSNVNLKSHKAFLDEMTQENPATLFLMPHLNHRDHPLDIIDILLEREIQLFGSEYPFLQAQLGYAITFPLEEKFPKMPYKMLLHDVGRYATDFSPVDQNCECLCCKQYTRAYICHLLQAHEMSAFVLLTFHNLFHFYKFFGKLNEARDSRQGLEQLRRILKESQNGLRLACVGGWWGIGDWNDTEEYIPDALAQTPSMIHTKYHQMSPESNLDAPDSYRHR
eukprot:CAMPEP_0117447024 /NCGR_PEP_ID=MMETSP0759-20121206/6653_1 /TAXON_ID=63605 /ORGANISM="Percolomonas cosmopolitus, Strain WS" /LENGTH=482 /DNA_ID=CAMNT_0005239329 /DNA_START=65 /DNA_END=1514 /DNA_ORIENTATION=-